MNKKLSHFLQEAGVASRRKCDALIFDGKVQVNKKIIREPYFRIANSDVITIANKKINQAEPKLSFILNKPKGFICSNNSQKSVLKLFSDIPYRLFTVGRLDKETTGLLLVTNDGQLANQIIHPSYNIEKQYLVKTNKEITDIHLKNIFHGTDIEGTFVKPISVKKVRRGTVKITVGEGKKHEVRLLLKHADLEVLDLKRIRIGSLHLGNLPEGKWRVMTEREKKALIS